ncbi:MAG: DinB family protein [Thermomicrobiales bacterium]
MNDRAERLATHLERVTDELVTAIEARPEGHWRSISPVEEWTVGTTVHHIAGVTELVMGLVQALVANQPLPPLTWDVVDAGNAQHAAEHPSPNRLETLTHLRRATDDAARVIRQLTNEQLDRASPWGLDDGEPISAEQLIERNIIAHTRQHLASIMVADDSVASVAADD